MEKVHELSNSEYKPSSESFSINNKLVKATCFLVFCWFLAHSARKVHNVALIYKVLTTVRINAAFF